MQLGKTEPMSLMRKTELSESKGIIKPTRASEKTQQADTYSQTRWPEFLPEAHMTEREQTPRSWSPHLLKSACFHCTHVNTINKM